MVQNQCEPLTQWLLAGFFLMNLKGYIFMEGNKLLRYSMQLAMLKQLFTNKLISEMEYKMIERRLMRDYGIVSNITA